MRLPAFTSASTGGARWAMSFADLCLVLLGFLLMLQAHKSDPAALGAGVRAAFGVSQPSSYDEAVSGLFEPGEAVLSAPARARFRAMGRTAALRGGVVHVESLGTDRAANRFDGWELAAARTAAIARAVEQGGLDPQRIDLTIDGTGPAARQVGQHVRVTVSAS